MLKYIFLIIIFCFVANGFAQEADSVFAVKKGSVFAIRHVLKNRETLSMLAQRYYISLMEIETANQFDAKKKLAVGDNIYIPLNSNNYFIHKQPLEVTDLNKLYYRVGEKDNMSLLINFFPSIKNEKPVTKDDFRIMNDMHGYNIQPDQALFIGWIRMLPRDSLNVARGVGYPAPLKPITAKDTIKHYFGGLDTAYNNATSNGLNVLTEKGTAVFFEKPGKNNMYFAFHNTTPRNTVIKVTNPGNNKSVFVKVIGAIPDTKNFSNCIIGISNAAKEDLGINDSRSWVELSYPVN